jgi:small-conductance mechanosensitive channel
VDQFLARLAAWDVRLFTLGGSAVTLFGLLWIVLLTIALVYVARGAKLWTVNRLLRHTALDIGTRQAIGAIVRYTLLVVGFLAIVQTAGINLTTLNVLAGALAVGVGFGLQNIFSNFISGLILMLDRPIRPGDRIEIAGAEGEVKHIGARRTTILTNDRVAIIVPNQRFVTDNVINLGYYEAPVRVRLNVPVQHGPDPHAVEQVLLGVARSNTDVLSVPPPAVRLLNVAGTMQFELQVWNHTHLHRRDQLVSELNFAVLEALRAHGMQPA